MYTSTNPVTGTAVNLGTFSSTAAIHTLQNLPVGTNTITATAVDNTRTQSAACTFTYQRTGKIVFLHNLHLYIPSFKKNFKKVSNTYFERKNVHAWSFNT